MIKGTDKGLVPREGGGKTRSILSPDEITGKEEESFLRPGQGLFDETCHDELMPKYHISA